MKRNGFLKRFLLLMAVFLITAGLGSAVHAADYSSNMLSQIQPYYTSSAFYGRYGEGEVLMGGQTYADSFMLNSFNNINAEAAFYLEGKYKSISFTVGTVTDNNTKNTRTMTVYCDDKIVWQQVITEKDLPYNSGTINLSGVKELKFVVSGSPSYFWTAVGNINLSAGGYTREERMKPITSNLDVSAFSSNRYAIGDVVMGDKNFEKALKFNSYNSIEAYALYNLQNNYKSMSFWVGNEKNSVDLQTRTVTVKGDEKVLFSRAVCSDDAPVYAEVSLAGVSKLEINVSGTPSDYNTVVGGLNLVSKYIDISQTTVTVENITYTGKALKPKVTVKCAGKTLVLNTDYTVSYSKNVAAGTGTAVIRGKGNFTGSVTKTFKIMKAAQKLSVKAASTTLAVGKTAGITVKASGKLTYSTSNKKIATITAKGKITAKAPGKVTITVRAAETANYKAAKTTFELVVNPKGTSLTSAKNSGKGKVTLKWKKVSGVTGYQIKYVVGSSEKAVTVKKASAKSVSVNKLKKGKTYKFYIRSYKTVNKVNYYSSWSKVKQVKVKK